MINIKNNPFLINVITLVSGTAISQGILLAATPFLTRLYNPTEFGIFALYVSIVGIISVVASWKYEMAILLPKEEEDAQALLYLSILITLITTLVILVLCLIFHNIIKKYFEHFSTFIWLVPLGVLITGLLQIFSSWATRKEYYKIISSSRIAQSLSTATGQGTLKFVKFSGSGLIWGHLIGSSIALITFIILTIKKQSLNLQLLSGKRIKYNMRRYSDFPKYQSFAVLINSFSQNLPIMLLTLFYKPEIAGFYSLTHRALSTPIRLVGGSVRQVYYQKSAKLYSENLDIRRIFITTTANLAKLSIVPYIVLTIFAPTIFIYVFGLEWGTSGIYAQILMSFFFLMTINPPAVVTLQVFGLQKYNLIYEISLALFSFIALFIGYKFYNNHYVSIGLYSFIGTLFNAILIYFIYKRIQLYKSSDNKIDTKN